MSGTAAKASLPNDGLPVLPFRDRSTFYGWLSEHHASASGLWLLFYKKSSDLPSINWEQAVEVALCFGWIDSLVRRVDDRSHVQRFTPRRPRSLWSRKNVVTCERLIAEGRLHAAGLAEVERARSDGRWEAAYHGPRDMPVPEDFLTALASHPEAQARFEQLNKSARFAIAFGLHTAKRADTRARRMQQFLDKLASGEPIH